LLRRGVAMLAALVLSFVLLDGAGAATDNAATPAPSLVSLMYAVDAQTRAVYARSAQLLNGVVLLYQIPRLKVAETAPVVAPAPANGKLTLCKLSTKNDDSAPQPRLTKTRL
jgi:hypothetical protein